MAQLECNGCRTLLMYIRGASSVQCSICQLVNLAVQGPSYARIVSLTTRKLSLNTSAS